MLLGEVTPGSHICGDCTENAARECHGMHTRARGSRPGYVSFLSARSLLARRGRNEALDGPDRRCGDAVGVPRQEYDPFSVPTETHFIDELYSAIELGRQRPVDRYAPDVPAILLQG